MTSRFDAKIMFNSIKAQTHKKRGKCILGDVQLNPGKLFDYIVTKYTSVTWYPKHMCSVYFCLLFFLAGVVLEWCHGLYDLFLYEPCALCSFYGHDVCENLSFRFLHRWLSSMFCWTISWTRCTNSFVNCERMAEWMHVNLIEKKNCYV